MTFKHTLLFSQFLYLFLADNLTSITPANSFLIYFRLGHHAENTADFIKAGFANDSYFNLQLLEIIATWSYVINYYQIISPA